MNYEINKLFDLSEMVANTPHGSKNARIGEIIQGQGGKWVPCATEVASGIYYASLFQLEPGHWQVCIPDLPMTCADTALLRAIQLAAVAAA